MTWPAPTPMVCDNCGLPVAFDPGHQVLAHPKWRTFAAWCCQEKDHDGRTTVAEVDGLRKLSEVTA